MSLVDCRPVVTRGRLAKARTTNSRRNFIGIRGTIRLQEWNFRFMMYQKTTMAAMMTMLSPFDM